MSPNIHTQSNADFDAEMTKLFEEVAEQVYSRTPDAVIKAIAVQIYTAREARVRINEEGSVVRDTKGAVVPHPAIKIEADAIKLYASLIAANKKPKPSFDD